MGYGIGLEKICEHCGNDDYIEVANITYNISPMYRKAFGGDGINDLNEILAEKAIPKIVKAIDEMANNKTEYEKLNPANGYGSYNGALSVLQKLLSACAGHMFHIIRID